MNFTLYQLNPDFWARVQAKAKAEGTTVKAVILKLLATWLGVLALAAHDGLLKNSHVAAQSHDRQPGPVPDAHAGRRATAHRPPTVVRSAPEVGQPISLHRDERRGQYVGRVELRQWRQQLTARGNGRRLSECRHVPGRGITTATAAQSDQASVTVARQTTPPRRHADPPNTNGFEVTIAFRAAGSATHCQATVTYNGVVQPSGTVTDVAQDRRREYGPRNIPVSSHVYAAGHQHRVRVASVRAAQPAPSGRIDADHGPLAGPVTGPGRWRIDRSCTAVITWPYCCSCSVTS
jgi:hypothetical protein